MSAFSGKLLQEARERTGQPVEYLALKIKRGAECVRRYERGTIDPPASIVAQLADALDVPVASLFDDNEHRAAA